MKVEEDNRKRQTYRTTTKMTDVRKRVVRPLHVLNCQARRNRREKNLRQAAKEPDNGI